VAYPNWPLISAGVCVVFIAVLLATFNTKLRVLDIFSAFLLFGAAVLSVLIVLYTRSLRRAQQVQLDTEERLQQMADNIQEIFWKAFDYLGPDAVVTNESHTLNVADKIVLPGVGHFSSLRALNRSGLREALLRDTSLGKPFLGICLGMQWLFEGSEECSEVAGSGFFNGRCRRFPPSVKSPHVGWNSLTVQEGSRLLRGIAQDSFVYYTHSFYAPVLATTSAATQYGLRFTAAVERQNIFGVQFHPEKSGDVGLAILKTFCEV
jgi:glutamine amidotransferase